MKDTRVSLEAIQLYFYVKRYNSPLLKPLDMTTSKPIEDAMPLFDQLLSELEKLL